ncbi:MAG: phosphoribosylformylglycinamidine cyclo-ligase [Clostridia bacterium]|nr:phosphoribosylformylglycinamidine cyclo-ligase [Clostridia bacterium]
MQDSFSDAYAAAGVDITAGYRGVELMKKHIERTLIPGAGKVGDFGGVFALPDAGMREPCLVSGTDGVGTKIRIAQLLGRHVTVGIDCVAMCVNDIVCAGARPLFFLDYIAIGKNVPEKVAEIVAGVAEGCVEAGCALIGGETAEHPGLMEPDDYDLAGFAVGLVDKADMLGSSRVREGDVLIGLRSSGLHSNGYSLVRKVFDVENADLSLMLEETQRPLGEELLQPTEIYVRPVLSAMKTGGLHAAAHITGGGLIENLPRCLPAGLEAEIDYEAWEVPGIFCAVAARGQVSRRDMLNTFNMGIGMVLVGAPQAEQEIMKAAQEAGARPVRIGRVVREQSV